jgi:hypothetical protein
MDNGLIDFLIIYVLDFFGSDFGFKVLAYGFATLFALFSVYCYGLLACKIGTLFSKESPKRPTVFNEDFFNQSNGVNSSSIYNMDESVFDHSPISNIDGSMMVGSLDVHGNIYGVASSSSNLSIDLASPTSTDMNHI